MSTRIWVPRVFTNLNFERRFKNLSSCPLKSFYRSQNISGLGLNQLTLNQIVWLFGLGLVWWKQNILSEAFITFCRADLCKIIKIQTREQRQESEKSSCVKQTCCNFLKSSVSPLVSGKLSISSALRTLSSLKKKKIAFHSL